MPPSQPPERTRPIGAAGPTGRGWVAACVVRVRHRPWLKTLGITAFMWLFFVAYFHLLRHPARPVLVMPLTALDHAIGFQPAALGAYVSLWIYVGIPPGLMRSLRELVLYGLWTAALCLAGLACFWILPTAVPAPELALDVARNPAFALLQGVDAAGNACPSLHVATALYSALWIERLLREVGAPPWARLLNGCWLALIVYSTLAIKQHVALDAAAGIVLGGLFAWASLRWFPRPGGPAGGGR